jgi:hypothetical protein
VEATVTADTGDLTNERHAVQLLDPVSGLARETITSSRGGPEEASVIDNESVRVMGEGANVQVIRSVQLRPPTGLPLPLYELSPMFLEDAQAISASLKDDGSWELVLRPRITAREAQMMAGDLGDLLIVVGPDLLPRRTERTIHYSTGGGTAEPDGTTSTWQSEQTSIERIEYRIEPIDGLQEQDVRLTLPQDYRVAQLFTELALDRPRADVTWPQYWLGPQFLDLKLYNAAFVVGDPDETTRSEHTMSVYGSSGQPPWEQSIQLITNKRQPGEPDDWAQMTEPPLPGDTTEEMTVAGRTATVHTRVVSTPVAAFVVQIVFPDVTVQITAVGLPPEAAKTVIEELREM